MNEYQIDLACYVIGPNRGYTWTGKSFAECLDQAKTDIRKWIKEDRDAWKAYNYIWTSKMKNNLPSDK